jgi:hypothetical protein
MREPLLHLGMFKAASVEERLKVVEERVEKKWTEILDEIDKSPRDLWAYC